MTGLLPRHRWLLATGAAASLALTACSGSSTSAPPARSTAPPSASPSAAAAPAVGSGGAAAALRRAIAATKAVRSYRFAAQQTLTGGPTPQSTRLTGRAIRPAALTYTLTSGRTTEQVVRLGAITYRRIPPGPYKRLVKATPPADPLGSVIAVLSRVADVTSRPSRGGTDFTGSLSGSAAHDAGLVGNASPAPGLTIPVRVSTDRRGRVTRLELTEPLRVGSRQVVLRQVATYGGFNAQPAIRRPR